MAGRDPFQPLSVENTCPSTPSSSRSTPTSKLLAPIFTRTYSRPRPTTTAGPSSSPLAGKNGDASNLDMRASKRARLDTSDVDENGHATHKRGGHSIQAWFVTTPLRGESYHPESKEKGKQREEPLGQGEWRRRRGRGVGRMSMMTSYHPPASKPLSYLDTLVTRLTYDPDAPPSALFVPSLHSWDGPRDYAPPLAVAFSHSAKFLSAQDARSRSTRRLIAVAAEEGGVRVVDVDEGLGPHPDAQGWFWRAHANAILDLKWSKDDKRILTASGDATSRLHALDGPNPTLIASLSGHFSTVKSCTFFDPTGTHIDPSHSSCIATAGRDGNILIYDIRAPGNAAYPSNAVRRSGRPARYSDGVEGFAPQVGGEIKPIMEILAAHAPDRKKDRSLTSLVALQTMPGRLASGAAHDAAIRLWDPRFNARGSPQPFAVLADPTAVSRRPRGIHSMVEQLTTGDLHILTGANRVQVVRPSALGQSPEAIQPVEYYHEQLRSSFWQRLSFSPCGRYLAAGSISGGMMTWDTEAKGVRSSTPRGVIHEAAAQRLQVGHAGSASARGREVSAVDWAYDMVAACVDNNVTRIWRSDAETAAQLQADPRLSSEYAGAA